jgi:hypothetical protein
MLNPRRCIGAESAADKSAPLFRQPKDHIGLPEMIAMRAARVRPWLWTIDPWRLALGCSLKVWPIWARNVIPLHDGIESSLDPSTLDRTATLAALSEIVSLT